MNRPYPENNILVYDFLANHYGYITMEHMVAVAHALIIAKAIANPDKVGPAVVKAIEQTQNNIRPLEKKEALKPATESKEQLFERIAEHAMKVTKASPPS